VAEWVLAKGGGVANSTDWEAMVRAAKDLPPGDFPVVTVDLTDSEQIADADLENLNGLPNLRRLAIPRTRVGDAGLAHLKGLTTLQTLELDDTQVTDGGLKALHALTNLRELNLTGTRVTAAGVAELQKALPKCRILTGPKD